MKMQRGKSRELGDVLMEWLRQSKISSGYNTRRIFAAWDEATGLASCTLNRYFRDGRLYVTLSSSAVRSTLQFQKEEIIRSINVILSRDPLFIKDDPNVKYVRELILK